MELRDLRSFIDKLRELNEIKVVENADWNLEIGAITELMFERGGPALLFDKIKGYPEGYRVATHLLGTPRRLKILLGLEGLTDIEVVKWFKDKLNEFKPIKPTVVKEGPVLENVHEGDEINMFEFPVPKWHELDGGRYIGTGSMIITKDPDEGWINVGTYRVMIHDSRTLSFYISPGKHGDIMRRKYWAKGKNCPVVMCFGQDMLLWICSSLTLPWGVSELDFAGFIRGRPVEVIEGRYTGLPIPADAEIAIEGEAPPPEVESRPEGPFGEWSGYYASKIRNEPVVKVKAVYHRNNPILVGQAPYKSPHSSWYPIPIHSASLIWHWLERNGIEGVKGVWGYGPGNRRIIVVSVEQAYPGHAKRIASLVAALTKGHGFGTFIITVDDDIDPSNIDDVLWALTTRCYPETSIDIVRGFLTSALEPALPPEKREEGDFTVAKVLIDACKPFHWRKEFPPVNKFSEEYRKKILEKWKKYLVS